MKQLCFLKLINSFFFLKFFIFEFFHLIKLLLKEKRKNLSCQDNNVLNHSLYIVNTALWRWRSNKFSARENVNIVYAVNNSFTSYNLLFSHIPKRT